jgi:hypothetical protein
VDYSEPIRRYNRCGTGRPPLPAPPLGAPPVWRCAAPAGLQLIWNSLPQPALPPAAARREHGIPAPPHPFPGSGRTDVLTTGALLWLAWFLSGFFVCRSGLLTMREEEGARLPPPMAALPHSVRVRPAGVTHTVELGPEPPHPLAPCRDRRLACRIQRRAHGGHAVRGLVAAAGARSRKPLLPPGRLRALAQLLGEARFGARRPQRSAAQGAVRRQQQQLEAACPSPHTCTHRRMCACLTQRATRPCAASTLSASRRPSTSSCATARCAEWRASGWARV